MKRVLITGANGFLGVRLARHLAGEYRVFTPSRSEMDITNAEQVNKVLADLNPEVVIHCAAVSNTQFCEQNEALSYRVNVEGAVHLADGAAAIGAKLVFCSSDQVYNGVTHSLAPHRECESLTPQGVYAQHKLEAECRVMAAHAGAVCLRLTWMYDEHCVLAHEHSDLYRTLAEALRTGAPIAYPVHDYRGITSVDEVVRGIESAFDLPGDVYNFGATNHRSTYETLVALFAHWGIPTNRVGRNVEAFAQSPRNLCMNIEKVASLGLCFSDTLEGLKKQNVPVL